MIHYFAIFFIFLLIPLGFSSTFGEVVDFTTNKSLYRQWDQLSISGNVFYDPEFPTITIQIFNPNKSNFVWVDVVIVNPDGWFSSDFRVGGIQWQADGTYTIKITYAGNMEKSIESEESLPIQSISESTPKPTPNHESTVFEKFPSNFITFKF